jgi:hypothetical protein
MSITLKSGGSTVRRSAGGALAAFFAAALLAISAGTPTYASTGAVVGEYDIVAASLAQSPVVQSFNHEDDEWDEVINPNAWFAVGDGKVIDAEEDATAVSGGGVRIVNASGSTDDVRLTFTFADDDDSVVIYNQLGAAVFDSTVSNAWTIRNVSPGTFHQHFTWEFESLDDEAAITIAVLDGAGFSGQSQDYLFTF